MPESDWEVGQTANLVSKLSLRENCESGNLSSPSIFQTTKGRGNDIGRTKRTVARGGNLESVRSKLCRFALLLPTRCFVHGLCIYLPLITTLWIFNNCAH